MNQEENKAIKNENKRKGERIEYTTKMGAMLEEKGIHTQIKPNEVAQNVSTLQIPQQVQSLNDPLAHMI